MTNTMRAAVVTKLGDPLDIRDVKRPDPGPGEILVKVAASGVCHTDLHAANGDWPVKPTPPFIPGHEGVGTVAGVGVGVTAVREGDRVGVPWLYSACGHCEHCVGGWETLCTSQRNTGYSVNGAFADYVLADPNYVGHLPDGLEFGAAAPILCAGLTVYKGLKQTSVEPGQWLAVSGIGGLGHMAVQYAKVMGMRCIAVDIAADKLDLAKSLGADEVINAAEEDPVARISKEIGGVHGVLVTAVSTGAFKQAVGMLRNHGTMSLVGLPAGTFPTPVFDVVLKGLTIRGSIVGTRQDLTEALDFASEGLVAPHFAWDKLDNINGILDRLRNGDVTGRIVLDMT